MVLVFGLWTLDSHLHLAPKVLLRKDSGESRLGPILTTLDFVLPFGGVRDLNKGGWLGGLPFEVGWLAFNRFEVYAGDPFLR